MTCHPGVPSRSSLFFCPYFNVHQGPHKHYNHFIAVKFYSVVFVILLAIGVGIANRISVGLVYDLLGVA